MVRVHFVNTGPKFPYAYYLGVISAIRAFGDKVKLWLVERPAGMYFNCLSGKVEIVNYPYDIPDFPMLHDRDEHFKRVTLFDNCIWRIVAEEGGTIMGLDSFTIAPFHDLLEDDKEMLVGLDAPNLDDSFCMHGVTCRPGSVVAAKIYEDSSRALYGQEVWGVHDAIKNGKLRFGGAGIIPFLNYALFNMDKLSIAEFGVLSGFHHREALHPDCRTIPHYATSEKGEFERMTEGNVIRGGIKLAQVVKDTLGPADYQPDRRYRFHLLGLVHLPVSRRFMGCAFTQKIVKLSKMLMDLGHEVYLYGAEGSDAPCTEFVQTHTMRDIRQEWGSGDNRPECDGLGYPWRETGFRHDFNSTRTPTTMNYYVNCVREINGRKRDDDFLLLMQGVYQKPVSDGANLWLTCEPGIGYRGSFARFRAFESAYLQNFTYGSERPGQCINGHYYDRVIPNYFEAEDFPFQPDKGDYFLYIGRMITRKGVWTAIKATGTIGARLVLAGQESDEIDVGKLPGHCEFVGYVDPEQRAELMGKAKAVFVPTLYLEAFGGVNVEAQLCGTPVITTNFGVFPETVENGVTGFLCNTLDDFVWAAKNVDRLDYHVIRQHAERYLTSSVKWEFERWFCDLYDLWESAHIEGKQGWHRRRDFLPAWRARCS